MTAITEFFCDYCNPSRQRRTPDMEVSTGYAVEMAGGFPLGWWEVPRKGPSGATGHACPECVLKEDVGRDVTARRSAETARITGDPPRDQATADAYNEFYGLEGDERVGPGSTFAERARALAESPVPPGSKLHDAPRWPSKESPFGDARQDDGT